VLFNHLFALLSARSALFRAFLAMCHIMHFAFAGTCFADVGAGRTKQSRMRSANRHQLGGRSAGCSAFTIKLDALDHHFNILLLETFCGAVFACQSTRDTCVNARLKFFVAHLDGDFV
jgi:hypothetical protein